MEGGHLPHSMACKTRETEPMLIRVGASACSLKIDFLGLAASAEDVGALLRLLWPTMGSCLLLACIPTRSSSGHSQQHDSKEPVVPERRDYRDSARIRKGHQKAEYFQGSMVAR